MKIIKLFFIWQDDNEEAWLNQLSQQGLNLSSVKFPFTYIFNEDSQEKFAHHLNVPKDAMISSDSFLKPFIDSGWEHVGRMNGWHYFRKRHSSDSVPDMEWGNETKAAKFQRSMMGLVGLLPFLLIIFPAFGRRIPQPIYGILQIVFFAFLAIYTVITYKVYRRVNQLRDH